MMDFVAWLISAFLVAVTIGIHYELMRFVSDAVLPWATRRFHDRRVMLLMIMSLMLGHIAEIWIFAVAMAAILSHSSWGALSGAFDGDFNTIVYFSAASYTSVGYGDITPHGFMRALSVSESLTGLLMIAWSASFTYLKMEQVWNRHRPKNSL